MLDLRPFPLCPNHEVVPTCRCGENRACMVCGYGQGAMPCRCQREDALDDADDVREAQDIEKRLFPMSDIEVLQADIRRLQAALTAATTAREADKEALHNLRAAKSLLTELWSLNHFEWDTMPEAAKREAHRVTVAYTDALLKTDTLLRTFDAEQADNRRELEAAYADLAQATTAREAAEAARDEANAKAVIVGLRAFLAERASRAAMTNQAPLIDYRDMLHALDRLAQGKEKEAKL